MSATTQPQDQQDTVRTIFEAMVALRKGKITPDAFRSVMRTSREQHGENQHGLLKAQAAARFSR